MTWDVSGILEQYNLGYEPDIKAITVTVSRGVVSIRESWRDEAEIWSDGVTARLPISVWTNVVQWVARDSDVASLAQSFLDRADEDWTFTDPDDIKRLARAVLGK